MYLYFASGASKFLPSFCEFQRISMNFNFKSKLNKPLAGISIFLAIVLIGFLIGYLIVRASPDSISDTFTDETYVGKGTEKVEIATTTGQVKLAECYSPDPDWNWSTTTIVRDISVIDNSDATTTKTIYCDDYNCILYTYGMATPTTVCIATDSNVYGNILWSKTDSGSKSWADSNFSISGDDIGGTHPSNLQCGDENKTIGAENWLEIYYATTTGTFDAMDVCKAKGSGWRLPTILELDSIRDQAKGSSPYSRLPNILASYYWSSTEYSSNYAYRLYFSGGQVVYSGKTYSYYVRCVREY